MPSAQSAETAESIFGRFADPERDGLAITIGGLAELCSEIGVDAEDIRALVLAWKLGAKERPGEIQRGEFINGMQAMRLSTIKGLKAAAPGLDPGFLDADEFRDMFRFCFQFNLEGTLKTIERDVIVELLPLAMCGRSHFTASFTEYLGQSSVTRISADQWNSFLEFSNTVDTEVIICTNYKWVSNYVSSMNLIFCVRFVIQIKTVPALRRGRRVASAHR